MTKSEATQAIIEMLDYIAALEDERNANRHNMELVTKIQAQINDWREKLATLQAQYS